MEPLATLAELEVYLGRTMNDVAQANMLLETASSAVRTYCGWELSRTDQTMYSEAPQSGCLITLPTLHLVSVDQVRCNGNPVDLTLYPINHSVKGQIWGAWAPLQQYEFDVTHGYDPIPDFLKLVTMDLTSRHLANPEGLTSATTGQVSRTWGKVTEGSPFSPLHAALLDRYSL